MAFVANSFSQTLGGQTVFNFINQPNTANLSAFGGINISSNSKQVGLAFHNPALLNAAHNGQIDVGFNNFIAGIKAYSLITAASLKNNKTTIAAGTLFINYGITTQTDASGNVIGNFKPVDYLVQAQTSHCFTDSWNAGITVKYINSNYAGFTSNALAADVGVHYNDTSGKLSFGIVIKNIGSRLKKYTSSSNQAELPFNVQAGITKAFTKAPFRLSLTAHSLQSFSKYYYNDGEDYSSTPSSLQKFFNHIIIATEIIINPKLEATLAYNFMRRQELNIYGATNGFNGLSGGFSLYLKKFSFSYGTGFYQQQNLHQISFQFGISK